MRNTERIDRRLLSNKVLKRHKIYHLNAISGLSKGLTVYPERVEFLLRISQHRRQIGEINTELVSLKRVSNRI